MDLEKKLQIIDEIKKASDSMIGEFINKVDVQNEIKSWNIKKLNAFAKELEENYTYQNLKKLYESYKEQEG